MMMNWKWSGRDLFWFNLDHTRKLANSSRGREANPTNGREELQPSNQRNYF